MDEFGGNNDHVQSIQLHLDDPNPVIERFAIYPYPDLTKLWVRLLLSPFERYPNLEIRVMEAKGEEVGSAFLVEQREQNISFTMHLREPCPGTAYSALATLSWRAHPDVQDNTEEIVLDQKQLRFELVFVDPQAADR